MPTPAVNINDDPLTEYETRSRSSEDSPWGPWTVDTFRSANRYIETRPASSAVPLVRGFRKCKDWNHYISRGDIGTSQASQSFSGKVLREYRGQLWAAPIDAGQLVSNNVVNRAIAECKVKIQQGDFNLGLFIVEGRQTVALVSSAFKSIARQVRRFRERHPTQWELAKRYEGHVGKLLWCKIPPAWLELQYGWKPLMSDVQAAVTHLYNRQKFSIPYITATRVVKESGTQTLAMNGPLAGGGFSDHLYERGATCFLCYGLSNPVLAEISSLGLINVPLLIWEKVPYSFVVDWAVPIGTYLQSMSSTFGYDFVTGGVTRWYRSTLSGVRPTTLGSISTNVPPFNGRCVRVERKCFNSSPFPGLYVKNPISTLHLANATALLIQAFGRK